MQANGKILGVLGGMGPAAAAEFLRLLAVKAPARTDQEHPRVIMYGDTQLPDRSAGMLGEGPSPEPQLKEDIDKLIAWGADVVCAPCNSAHYFINHFLGEIAVPLVHIIEETVRAAREISPAGAWLLGTKGTMQSGMYQAEAARIGYPLREVPPAVAQQSEASLRAIKSGDMTAAAAAMTEAAERLWATADLPLMLACTELPLAYDATDLSPERAVSSLSALADACLRVLYES